MFNVAGNLALVPHFGVTASAWLTVATEVGVALGFALGLRGLIEFRWAVRVTVVPVLAMLAMVGVWALTDRWVLPSMVASGVAFLAAAHRPRRLAQGDPAPTPPSSRPLEAPVTTAHPPAGHPVGPIRHVVVIRPDQGGIAYVAGATVVELRAWGTDVTELVGDDEGSPALDGLRTVWRNRDRIRAADVVHVELGRTALAAFWIGIWG